MCYPRGMTRPTRKIDDETKQLFLDNLAATGVVSEAARAAGFTSYSSLYQLRKSDPEFAEAWTEALDNAADMLELEARRRAVQGVTRVKVIGSGENAQMIDEVHYSDTLLLALLKAKKPSEFAERSKTEISGPDGKAIETNDTSAAARLLAILEEAKLRRDAGRDPLFD